MFISVYVALPVLCSILFSCLLLQHNWYVHLWSFLMKRNGKIKQYLSLISACNWKYLQRCTLSVPLKRLRVTVLVYLLWVQCGDWMVHQSQFVIILLWCVVKCYFGIIYAIPFSFNKLSYHTVRFVCLFDQLNCWIASRSGHIGI